MKIGILTFHRPINYGAFLQSYGLSNRLKKEYPAAGIEIIDYIAPLENKKIYRTVLSRLKRSGISGAITEICKIKVFKRALDYLTLSDEFICTNDLKKLFLYIDSHYDMLIIGSDAVFNWNQNGYPTAFIPQYHFSIPVVTYAASVHGLKYFDEPQNRIAECGQAFKMMEAIFVRDECTSAFVNYCCKEKKPLHVCDPTFLIDFNQLYKIKHRSMDILRDKYKIQGKYIVLMLQDDDISKELRERIKNQYSIVTLFRSNKYADCFMYDLTPVEWSLVLKNAEVVITSYFHGTLLSLIQGTPTMVVDVSKYEGMYEGKLDDLMNKRLQLPDLYYKQGDWENNKEKFFDVFDRCLIGYYEQSIELGTMHEKQTYNSFATFINSIME